MTKKTTKKVDLNTIDDVEKTKKEVLDSVPQIPREQVPSGKETTKELLEGSTEIKEKAKVHIKK